MTLVEVLVASVLLGVGVAGLVSSATLAMRNQQRSEHRAMAVCLAQEVLSQVDVAGAHTWVETRPMEGTESRDDIALRWTLAIEQTSVAELHSVRVSIEWLAPGDSGRIELETLLNDYEAVSTLPQNQRRDERPKEAGPDAGKRR